MKKRALLLTAMVAMFGLASQGAEAGYRKKVDPRVKAVAIGTGAAATATYFAMNDWKWHWDKTSTRAAWVGSSGAYALTTVGCMAVSPMVATAVVGRELTMREAHVLAGSCVVPLVGGYIVNAVWDAHPEWEAPAKKRR